MFNLSSHNLSELDRQKCVDVTLARTKTFDIIQLKFDGIWCCLCSTGGVVKVFSRNGLLKEVIHIPGFPDAVFAGEFMFGSQWAQNPDRLGKIFLYDCLYVGGRDLRNEPYSVRYEHLVAKIPNHSRLVLVKHNYTTHAEELLEQLTKTRAYEGFVYRNWSDSFYGVCGRIKLDIEEDYVVIRCNPGEGKHLGRMGSLTVGQYKNNELASIMDVGGGFSDELRSKPTSFWVGKIITVTGKAKFTSGALRHPNFVRIRDDKTQFECLFSEPTT